MTGPRMVTVSSQAPGPNFYHGVLTGVRIDRQASGGIRIDGKDDMGREIILLPGTAPVSIVEVR